MASELRLGKAPATYDRRDLLFKEFKTAIPPAVYPSAPIGFGAQHEKLMGPDWQMFGNGPDDSVFPAFQGAGDCTIADAAHRTVYANKMAGRDVLITGRECIGVYSQLSGYNPNSGANDTGLNMRDVSNYMRNTGMLAADGSRHKIGGYCALQAGNFRELLQALAIFDVVSIGIEFPVSAMDQFNAGKAWTYVRSSPDEGGHDVMVSGRPSSEDGTAVTWARLQTFTKSFYSHKCDEAYGIFLPESMVAGKSPEGFAMADFVAALAAL